MSNLAVSLTVEQLGDLVSSRVREELAKTIFSEVPEVMTLEACAKFMDLSTKTVARLEREEGLPSHYLSPSDRRFRRSEVLAWLSARGKPEHKDT